MAVSLKHKNNTNASITLVAGATSLLLTLDRGDFSLSGLGHNLNEVIPVERRGKRVGLVTGARRYPTFSFTSWVTQFAAAADPGDLLDFALQKDAYSALVSTLGAGCPFTSDLTYGLEGTDFGDAADHSFTLHDCYYVLDLAEGADGITASVSGTVYGEITGDIALAQVS